METPSFVAPASASASRSTRKTRRKSTDVPGFRAAFPEGGDGIIDDELGVAVVPQVTQRSDTEERGGSGGKTGAPQRSRLRTSTRHAASRKQAVPCQDSSAQSPALFMRESTTAARQHLASSASRTRPAKQNAAMSETSSSNPSQKLAQWRAPMRPSQTMTTTTTTGPRDDRWPTYNAAVNGSSNNNNNNEDDDDFVIVQDQLRSRQLAGAAPVLYQGPPRNVTKADQHPSGRRGRFVQPPAHRFPADLEQFVGDPEESEEPSHTFDRPPSRQRHAFPTNLLDPREFMSPKQHADAAISITPWHIDDEDDTSPNCVEQSQTMAKTDRATEAPYASARPPSRYMTKAKRPSASSAPSNPPVIEQSPIGEPGGRLPSRRGLGSWNQTHHDPKMDGFADVDESVPPPFRIEITTGSYHSQYIPAARLRVPDDDRDDAHASGPQRRWSSFGNMSQLRQQMQDIGAPSFISPRPTIDAASRSSHPIERSSPWLSSVDEPAVQGNPAESSPRTASGREQLTPPSERNNNNNNNQSAHQWFHAPPQASCSSRFEDMDADTAIANTPLFESDDLMAITQLSDLRLDDFLADATLPIANASSFGQPKPLSTGSALKTSLGQDFLSLFAQH